MQMTPLHTSCVMQTWFSYSKSQKINLYTVLWIKPKQNKTKQKTVPRLFINLTQRHFL